MSGIQVARGQEKIQNPLSAYSTESTDKPEYVTGQEVGGKKRAMDAVIYGTYPLSTGNAISAIGTSGRTIQKTSHGARRNDVVQFTSGAMSGVAIQILSCPDANTIILAATPENALAVGDLFDVKRYVSPQYNSDGALSVVATQGPIQYDLDGTDTEVKKDTATASNTRALPVEVVGVLGADVIGSLTETAPATDTASSGLNGRLQRIAQRLTSLIALLPSSLGAKTGANSLSIVPASDAVFTINTESQTGQFAEDLSVSTTPETFTAPAGAFAALIEADDTNTTNIRVKMGATAGTASGIQFQPGRSEMYEAGTDISYCTESSTGKLSVQWFVRS